jgi:hypothetical protein
MSEISESVKDYFTSSALEPRRTDGFKGGASDFIASCARIIMDPSAPESSR